MSLTEIHWSLQLGFPILAALQLLPLFIMGTVLLNTQPRLAATIAIGGALAELGLGGLLYHYYDQELASLQFAESFTLYGPLTYHAAVDGIAVLFILLTGLLGLMVVIYSLERAKRIDERLIATLFAAQASLMTLFITTDLLWFVLFSLVQISIVGHMLGEWSTSPAKDDALRRYQQFMGIGLLLMLAATILLGWNHNLVHGRWSFDLFELATTPIPAELSSPLFFMLFYGLAVRIPLFPLHGWMPLVAEHGTIATIGVFLIGLKIGVFALLRFVFPLMPEAVIYWQPYIVAFAGAGIFYAALLALLQNNLRRLLAFAVVSHSGILTIGLFSLNHAALQGSVLLAINFGLAGAGLLFMTGMVYRRSRTMLLSRLGGLFDRIPIIGIAFLVAGLSIVGMPGTPGFDAAHLVLEAAIERFGALPTVAAALGNVVAAGFLLWAFQQAFLSPNEKAAEIPSTRISERLLAAGLILVLVVTGFYSEPWLQLIDTSLRGLETLYGHH